MTKSIRSPARRRATARPAPHRQPRRAVPALVALGLLLAALSGGLALRGDLGSAPVSVGENMVVNDGGPQQLVDARNSPTVARNPPDADNVVVAHRVDRPGFSAELHWSSDGGRRWSATELPLPADLDRPFAPDVAFGPDGTLFLTYSHLEGQGNVPASLWMARSTDGGRTLEGPWQVAGDLPFQPRVVVGPSGRVHVVYLQASNVATLQFAGPVAIVAVRSEDRGETFDDPVVLSDPDRPRVGAATPTVDGAGNLAVVYTDFKGNVRDFQNLEGPPWPDPAALVLTRSTDGGATFAPGVEVDAELFPAKRFLPFLPEFPSLAAGPDGAMVVVWSDARHGDEDVFARRSADGGATWGAAVRVNDNPRDDGTSQYLPAVDIAASGRVDVAYLDRRHDPDDVLTHTSLAYSTDGGASFEHVPVSSEPSDARIGATVSPHIDVDFGTRIGLVSDRDSALVAWTDTRLAESPDHGRQDVFAAAVELPDPAGRWRTPAAGAALLASFACLAGAAWLHRRPRRAGRP